jgi:hypothetical protein
VDDQDVAVSMVRDAFAHALAEEPFEDSGLMRADDDQVGVPLVCELHDRLGRLACGGYVVRLDPAAFEEGSRVLELFAMLLRCVGRIERSCRSCNSDEDRCDARDNELRIEGLGEVGGAPALCRRIRRRWSVASCRRSTRSCEKDHMPSGT